MISRPESFAREALGRSSTVRRGRRLASTRRRPAGMIWGAFRLAWFWQRAARVLCVRRLLFFNFAVVCFLRAASSDRALFLPLSFGFPEKRSEVVFPSIIVNVLGGTGFPWVMYLACTCGSICLRARGSIERGHVCARVPCPAGSVESGPRSHYHRSGLPVRQKECVAGSPRGLDGLA